jgi:hypothetical protein
LRNEIEPGGGNTAGFFVFGIRAVKLGNCREDKATETGFDVDVDRSRALAWSPS